jgi:hypothetical protein
MSEWPLDRLRAICLALPEAAALFLSFAACSVLRSSPGPGGHIDRAAQPPPRGYPYVLYSRQDRWRNGVMAGS